MTTPGVEIEGLTVGYDDVTALDDVSLSVTDGEFFTLVGPSGCGKTTTLRSIAGLESPDRGIVSIGGRDVTGESPEDRETGIVFQNYALFPHMSVRENVAYGLQFRDSPARDDDERVTELLELVEVADLADRDPDQLSGGQQQRVALARALAPEPAVLLLDEPLSALDAQLRQRLRVQIKRIQSELGITTVYVTHDQAEALAISDRVAVMREGRVEQVATPETVYREPATRFVAEFVGDNNVFDGVVAPDGTRATVGDAAIALPTGSDRARGESVAVAVRPEAITVGRDGADTAATERTVSLRATVETVEFLGDAYRVHCEWQGRTLVVKTDADEPPAGDVTLRVDPADVRVL
ncbi:MULTISPECIES: ABC transporter ATP-binding protein [Halomicrobium]|uniref:Molybdate/tungstate import ATP-binding protein WtpC n=2 Tax=Halomicrobium mukohataei TaxID=57705 RepID=C7P4M6_HALMD|nr:MULTISPECIES: ABC transporter ATP-binding protein [Halomicrobium]ACV48048.1 ABC transporter related [Halomicrobium mukohataei DSM 12286]QCD66480.1 ABC transporter ATP-binding protein [Halomicrobium mukohataei]QFR21286.1 ATP-binding cassette domain-containing protein [Halomicrobium sp. ZPS1]